MASEVIEEKDVHTPVQPPILSQIFRAIKASGVRQHMCDLKTSNE